MYFIGYHGTSEASARNILSVGVQARFLPKTGQIGRGFYVARANGTLPQWGAHNATAPARMHHSYFIHIISLLTGERNNPWLAENARQTILKIYSTRPLRHCKWNIMNPVDLAVLKDLHYDTGGFHESIKDDAKWLQMVIPEKELQFLHAKRDDGRYETPQNWIAKESPT